MTFNANAQCVQITNKKSIKIFIQIQLSFK